MEEPKKHINTGIRIFVSILCLCGVFLGGVYIGFENRPASNKIIGLINKEPEAIAAGADFAPFWKAWNLVQDKFPGADKTTTQQHVYGAIKGMLASFGDPYTTFFTPEESKVFESEISGEFGGVGMEMAQKDGILTVVAPLKNTPAYKAGILANDKIVKINDKSTKDLTTDGAIDLIRGEPGTKVSITIAREGASDFKVFDLIRDKISIPTVETENRKSAGVFVIKLYSFSAQSPELFRKALTEFADSGSSKLVLDLRNNPGGYLEAAVSMASWFLPEGEIIVKEIGKTEKDTVVHKSKGPGIFKDKIDMVILINKGSASASEILAGALSEYGTATLIGQQSFGKGSVQELMKLTSDTSIKITVAKWYTPKGISISDSGLTPKIILENNKEAGKDDQLEAAINFFKK
jgi:carboxyl-terminal processing protease